MAPKRTCAPVLGAGAGGGASLGGAARVVSLTAGAWSGEDGTGDLRKICSPTITITNPDTAIKRTSPIMDLGRPLLLSGSDLDCIGRPRM